MSTPKSIDEIMNEMNDRAKAEGRYLDKAFWEIPSGAESIQDAPSTSEAEQRLAALRAKRLTRSKKKAEESDGVAPAAKAEKPTEHKTV
jgi:hypothetical protein